MFSATFPVTIKGFIESHVKDVQEINLMEELTLKGVTQYYVYLEEKKKVNCLNLLFTKVLIHRNGSCKSIKPLSFAVLLEGLSCLPKKLLNMDIHACTSFYLSLATFTLE
jgi:ATP-dependent RNA helicase DDX6/DHH1